MSRRSQLLPIRILKIWFDVVLVVSGAAILLGLGWFLLSPLLMASREVPTDAAVHVSVGERSWLPVLAVDFEPIGSGNDLGIQRTRLVKGGGELRFLTTNWWLHFTTAGGFILGGAVMLYVIWALRKVVRNVLADRPFDAENGYYMRRSGYVLLVMAVVWPVLQFTLSKYVLSRIDVSTIDLYPAFNLDKDGFLVGLLFLVFGAILSRGYELQKHEQELEEEQALTI